MDLFSNFSEGNQTALGADLLIRKNHFWVFWYFTEKSGIININIILLVASYVDGNFNDIFRRTI